MDRLLLDIAVDGALTVSVGRGATPPEPVTEPIPFAWPLPVESAALLRWYLKDYLRTPVGAYGDRAEQIAAALPSCGEEIVSAVFGGDGRARRAFDVLRRSGKPLDVVVCSSVPDVLALPWELLREPESTRALVLEGARQPPPADRRGRAPPRRGRYPAADRHGDCAPGRDRRRRLPHRGPPSPGPTRCWPRRRRTGGVATAYGGATDRGPGVRPRWERALRGGALRRAGGPRGRLGLVAGAGAPAV
jgi:hypothetical protein